jgi:hypothetical protein
MKNIFFVSLDQILGKKIEKNLNVGGGEQSHPPTLFQMLEI